MDWRLDFVEAKYHLAVAERMMAGYAEYPEKRFLVGVINEAARAVSRLIRAYARIEYSQGVGGRNASLVGGGKNWRKVLDRFVKVIGPKYLSEVTCEHLVKVLEIERAQKESPIEFAKGDKIILLIKNKYRFLTAGRIAEFVKSVGDGVRGFPGFSREFRQV